MEKLNYFWKESKWEVFIAVLFTSLTLIWVGKTNDGSPFYVGDMSCWYSAWIDPVITIATLLVAIFVWVDSRLEAWKKSLPKKLDVHFVFDGKYILSCYNANLVGEHDIRALGQQIGAQMNGSNLDFYPMVSTSQPKIKKTGSNKSFLGFEVSFTLKKMPEGFNKKYLVWLVDVEDTHKVEPKSIPIRAKALHPKFHYLEKPTP